MSQVRILEAIRSRPAMYIGSTDSYGLTCLLRILLHAASTAADDGRGDEVRLRQEGDGACSLVFNGALWPPGLVTGPPSDTLARLLTLKEFDRNAPRSRSGEIFSSFFEDIGIINALSSELVVTQVSDGMAWRQRFRRGEADGPPHPLSLQEAGLPFSRSTCIQFVPDRSIFEGDVGFRSALSVFVEHLAALHPRVTYRLKDERDPWEQRLRFERGLADYAEQLSASARPLHAPWTFEGQHRTTQVRLALQWCQDPERRLVSWGNGYWASQGGAHETGLLLCLKHALQQMTPASWLAQEGPARGPVEPTRGLTAVLAVTVPEPVWYGPIKGKLANEECRHDVFELAHDWLRQRFEAEPELAKRIVELTHPPAEPVKKRRPAKKRGKPG